jgi:hypothetical protein
MFLFSAALPFLSKMFSAFTQPLGLRLAPWKNLSYGCSSSKNSATFKLISRLSAE